MMAKAPNFPTKILQNVFEAEKEELGEMTLEWINLPLNIKKDLLGCTKQELCVNRMPCQSDSNILSRLRKYYNNRRRVMKINKDPEKRRAVRLSRKVNTANYRMRNSKIREAQESGCLDTTDEKILKQFKLNVPRKSIEDIEQPPDSDDEEGQARMKSKKLSALAKGRATFINKFNLLRSSEREDRRSSVLWNTFNSTDNENLPIRTSSTPNQSCNSSNSNSQTLNAIYDWEFFEESQGLPWEEIQKFSFSEIQSIIEQEGFEPNLGNCCSKDITQLMPQKLQNPKMMHHLMQNCVRYINKNKGMLITKSFFPFNVSTVQCRNGEFEIAEKDAIKRIDKQRQLIKEGVYYICPVVCHTAEEFGKNKPYWCLAVAVIQGTRNTFAFIDSFGEESHENAKKIGYYMNCQMNKHGRWSMMTNDRYQQCENIIPQTTKSAADSGIIALLNAIQAISGIQFPDKVDAAEVRLWLLNRILHKSRFEAVADPLDDVHG